MQQPPGSPFLGHGLSSLGSLQQQVGLGDGGLGDGRLGVGI